MFRQLIIVWGLTCSFISLNAQVPYYFQYNTENGLPSSEVYDVERDSTGLMWFSTDRGVCTYDGYDFKTYTTQNGLADNTNFNIYKDSRERLWFTGHSGRVSIYEKGKLFPYLHNDSLLTFTDGDWLKDVIEIDEDAFLSTKYYTVAINAFYFKEEEPPIKLKKEKIKASLSTLEIDQDFIIRCKQNQGFHYVKEKPSKRKGPLYAINLALFHDDFILLYKDSTLFKVDERGNYLNSVKLDYLISKIYIDDEGHLWVCTTNGLFYFENNDLTRPPKLYFQDYHISSILKDPEGSFWITTNQSGVLFVPSFDIRCFQLNTKEKERHLSIEKLEQHIFFGTADSRIVAIDQNAKVTKIPSAKDVLAQNRYITKDNGVLRFNNRMRLTEKDGELVLLPKSFRNNSYVKTMKNKDIIAFSRTGFILIREKEIMASSRFDNQKFTEKLTTIYEDAQDNIWIGTLEGLYKIQNYNYQAIDPVLYNGGNPFGRINDIYGTPTGNRWIATIGNGLFYHTADTVFQVRKIDGLNSDLINQVIMTNDTTVWLATNKGVNTFNYRFKNNQLAIFNVSSLTTEDGLSSNYINDLDYWQEQIWLATNNGICSFSPSILRKEYPPVHTSINKLIVNDITYEIHKSLLFEHDENDIFINFTGISFKKRKEQPFYRYRLTQEEGVAPQWFYTNEKNIRYSNMSSGRYTFEVAAQNKSSQWSEHTAIVSFEIQPHFTETWWFLLLALNAVVGLLGFLVFRQFRRIQNREIEQRKLQEAELRTREAELTVLRSQMNPHFVFNSLNSIQNFIFKKDVEKANYYLASFSELMRNSLQYTQVDFISLEEELNFLKNYLELEVMRFEGKFKFEFKIDDTIEIDEVLVPSLLLQPIVENAVKHGFQHIKRQGEIEIEILQEETEILHVYIRDNGSGLIQDIPTEAPKKLKHKSLGLEIVQNRINLLNERNYTTKANVTFKNRLDEYNNPQGFVAHFILPIKYKA